ncbi:MAG TPA: type I-U CRISPR-associated helicase/endonuclease Cas3 [Gemmataceae bacterium]|nr:type I-U CRISPR-associated helicase/endonuclease Cas3 [Gemmataceae bacterium]
MSLTVNDFPRFFQAVNGYPPFPWQARLVHEITQHRSGYWPPVLSLPTSAGKTSALDIAVFLLALEVEDGKPKAVCARKAALRTFFIVDRRIVVDEAAEKARKLARLLYDPPAGARRELREVASRLRVFGAGKALHVAVLRGGMYRDESWAEAPHQPTICLSTVDQLGSRLLFRGYGVSRKQSAVHASLTGNDSLIIVDEAHLSRPFLETLKAIEFYRADRWAETPIRTPFQTVFMSATVQDATESVVPTAADAIHAARGCVFGLGDDAHGNDREHLVLKPRLETRKLARLEEDKGEAEGEEARRQHFAATIAGFARELAGPGVPTGLPKKGRKKKAEPDSGATPPVHVVGIVVNRVDTARRVFDLLEKEKEKESPAYDVILLTGRIRPYDRDRLLKEWLPFMEAKGNPDQTGYGRPLPPHGFLFVVATQTVEVGANISFDALVTEAAPLDALRQRFGRLDRLGYRKVSHAVIVTRKDLLGEDDPVYGTAIKATWGWLRERERERGQNKRIDFGITAISGRLPHGEALAVLCQEGTHAPVMLPAHLDSLVQTTVPPVPDPDPALFLHGPQTGPADVSVVWRADLTDDVLRNQDTAINVVSLIPPTSMEALPIPVWAVRRWMKGQPATEVSDVEAAREADDGRRPRERGKPCLRWCGPDDEDTKVIGPDAIDDEIRPGDTIVVPSEYGGADQYGWNPSEKEHPVIDVADDCSWRAKRKPVLRIHEASRVHAVALERWGVPPDASGRTLADVIQQQLDEEAETGGIDWDGIFHQITTWPGLPESLGWLTPRSIRRPPPEYEGRAGKGGTLVARHRVKHPDEPDDYLEADVEPLSGDDTDSFTDPDEPVLLQAHCQGVKSAFRDFDASLQLPADLRQVIERAALLHDAGKADERFQRWLHGNEADAAKAEAPIAKSSRVSSRNRAARNAARRRACWPRGARHEALSVLLVENSPSSTAEVSDRELLLYLIGSHHGLGRPVWLVADRDDLPASIDPRRDFPSRIECSLDGQVLAASGAFRPELSLARFDSGWTERFWQLVRRYGYWGLAYLETLLVLADHRQSELERGDRLLEGGHP